MFTRLHLMPFLLLLLSSYPWLVSSSSFATEREQSQTGAMTGVSFCRQAASGRRGFLRAACTILRMSIGHKLDGRHGTANCPCNTVDADSKGDKHCVGDTPPVAENSNDCVTSCSAATKLFGVGAPTPSARRLQQVREVLNALNRTESLGPLPRSQYRSPVCSCAWSRGAAGCADATRLICRLAPTSKICEDLQSPARDDALVLRYIQRICSQPTQLPQASNTTVSNASVAAKPPTQAPRATPLRKPEQVPPPRQSGQPNAQGQEAAPAVTTPTAYPPCICTYLGLGSSECRTAVKYTCNENELLDPAGNGGGITQLTAPGSAAGSAAGFRRQGPEGRLTLATGDTGFGFGYGSGSSVICSLGPAFQVGNASSLLSGGALRAIYRQLREACFPDAITAPSYCNCAVDPFSANCALSLTSLCSAGDPLCRLTLEAWEGQARATVVLRTFFNSTCGTKDGSSLAGIAGTDSDEVVLPLRTGGAARTDGSGRDAAARAVVVRLELPGVNRTAFEERYQGMLTSLIAAAAGVPGNAVKVNSAMELPAAGMTARSTNVLGSRNVAAIPKGASSPFLTGSNAAKTDARPALVGLPPRGERSIGVFEARVKATPEGAALASVQSNASGAISNHDVAATGGRRLVLQAQGSAGASPTALQDGLRVRSLLVTLTISTDKPLLAEQRLISALGDETWLSALQLQLRLPYPVSSFTTETYTGGDSELQDSEGGHGIVPSDNVEISTTALPSPGMSARSGQTAPGSTSPTTGVSSSPTPPPYLPGSDHQKAPGSGVDNSQALIYTGDNDGTSSGTDTDVASSQFIQRIVMPIVLSVLGGAVCVTAAVVIVILLRRRQDRRSSFSVATSWWRKNRKVRHLALAAEDTLVMSPSQVVSLVDAKAGAPVTPVIKVPVTSGGCSDGPQPTPTFSVHCSPPAEGRSIRAAGEDSGFTFPSLTPKAAAAAAAAAAATAATAGGARGSQETGKMEKSPILSGGPFEDASISMATAGCAKGDRILGAIRTTPPTGVQAVAGMVSHVDLADQGQMPQESDSPVLGLQPLLPSRPSTAPGVFPRKSAGLKLSGGADGQSGTLGLRSIGLPRSDSGMSGTTNVSHVAQMSPSSSLFWGHPLEGSLDT